ncbi:exosome nuclease subunit [Tulasnella sp. JGI-2019a]|nr:exosome nuclease subunit [Tulasnella sp. JGI-2019a]
MASSSSSSEAEPLIVPSPFTDFSAYQDLLKKTIISGAQHATRLPPRTDLVFQRTLDRQFGKDLDTCSERLLGLTNRMLRLFQGSGPSRSSTSSSKAKAKQLEEDDLTEGYHSTVVDIIDTLYESVDASLDEFSGRKQAAQSLPSESKTTAPLPKLEKHLLHARNLPKPQKQFKRQPDNSLAPWKHSLTQKLHASQPLNPHDPHPYRFEIMNIQYPATIFDVPTPQQPESFEATLFTWVDTASGLAELLAKLKAAREIAIDLEHHDYRTYSGFVCLMQISTRDEDFVVDTLALREELEVLNEVFANPNIIKVFHGAEMDIKWLQQDFNLYIVNLFDTFHAACELNFPKKSLSYLLSKYCEFTADKRYQLADWRIRPLPAEMLYYARSDTHFLLFVYDSLRKDLLEHSQGTDEAIRRVLQNSETTSLNIYGVDVRDVEESKDALMKRGNRSLNGKSRFIFDAIYAWRDRVAREEDESTSYVLPNHQLFALVEHPPVNAVKVLAAVRPTPPLVQARATELFKIIKDSLDAYLRSEIQRMNAAKAKAVHIGMDIDSGPHANVPTGPDEDTGPAGHPGAGTATVTSSVPLFAPSVTALPFITTSSSFFGKAPITWKAPAKSTRYMEIVDRVHRSLVITPSVPAILKVLGQKQPETVSPDGSQQHSATVPIPVEPEQIPFIHASKRQKPITGLNVKPTTTSHVPELDDDGDENPEIVAVKGAPIQNYKKSKQKARVQQQQPTAPGSSTLLMAVDEEGEPPNAYASGSGLVDNNDDILLLPKEKKRKRKDRDGAVHKADSVSTSLPYDYSAAPDILDQGGSDVMPQRQEKGKKKRKMENKAQIQKGLVSGVPSGPRQQNQPGSGNRSMTFKS